MPKTRSPSSSIYLNRRRWTAEDAKQALLAMERSGLSPGAFAAREGLDAQRLWRWRRKLGTSTAPVFEEIVCQDAVSGLEGHLPAPAERERFEIVLPSGRVVRVPASFDATALRHLLDVVDEVRPC
jgi:transposase-like protein